MGYARFITCTSMTSHAHHGVCNHSLFDCLFKACLQQGIQNPHYWPINAMVTYTVYPKKYALGFCFAVLCCGYTLTDFPISIRLTSLALWQSSDCPSASKATLMNMDKYFMWNHYERLHNHNKANRNKTVCIFLGIYCRLRRVCGGRTATLVPQTVRRPYGFYTNRTATSRFLARRKVIASLAVF